MAMGEGDCLLSGRLCIHNFETQLFMRVFLIFGFPFHIKVSLLAGTKMETLAWELAHQGVTTLIAQLITMPEYRHNYLEVPLRTVLTLADALVLVQH